VASVKTIQCLYNLTANSSGLEITIKLCPSVGVDGNIIHVHLYENRQFLIIASYVLNLISFSLKM